MIRTAENFKIKVSIIQFLVKYLLFELQMTDFSLCPQCERERDVSFH